MVFFFTMKGSLWPDSHQRDGGRGDVRGGDGLDRCQGRQGWRRGEYNLLHLLVFSMCLFALS